MSCAPPRFDPNTTTNEVQIARLGLTSEKILAPNWCADSLVRVEVSFTPDAAPAAVQPLALKAYRYVRNDNYDFAFAGSQNVASAAEIIAAQGPPVSYASFFVDLRNVGFVVLDNESTTVAMNSVVVRFSVPPTPVVPAPQSKAY